VTLLAERDRAARRRRGRLRIDAVRAAFKARVHGTMEARRRVAWRVMPGGDGALTSGPGAERKKTVGSRVTENSRIKNTPKRKIAQKNS
jgi:hypothetical protein